MELEIKTATELAFASVQKVIGGFALPNKKAIAEHAAWAKSMISGDAQQQKELVESFRRFEDDDLKAQRVRLYRSLTRFALSRPRRFWKKVKRVQGAAFRVEADGADEKIARLLIGFARFAKGKDLQTYVAETLERANTIDPNSWIVYERRNRTDSKGALYAEVYPILIKSECVVDFAHEDDVLKYLTVKSVRVEQNGKSVDTFEEYTVYCAHVTMTFRQKSANAQFYEGTTELMLGGNGRHNIYLVDTWEHGAQEVPARRTGAYESDLNDDLKVVWFEPAKEVLDDLVRDKSNLDVQKSVHTYARRYEFVKPCTHEHPTKGRCLRGKYEGAKGESCEVCGGSGQTANFGTEQQTLQLTLPVNARNEDLLNLGLLYHNEAVDISLPEWLRQQVDIAERRVMESILNPGILEKATGKEGVTATEVNYQYEDLQDVLENMFQEIEKHVELAWRVGLDYNEVRGNVSFKYPKDKKMKTTNQLLSDLEKAKSSGAGWDVVNGLRHQIWEKQYEDEPERVLKIKAQYEWLPWDDKGDSELAMILSSRHPLDPQRVLRENWGEIFGVIEKSHPEFFKYDYKKQETTVFEEVKKLSDKIMLDTVFERSQAQIVANDPTSE